MASKDKKVEVRFGAFSCSIEGYDDPVEKLRDIMGLMQNMIAETPALAESQEGFDADRISDALDEEVGATPGPGVVVIRNEGAPATDTSSASDAEVHFEPDLEDVGEHETIVPDPIDTEPSDVPTQNDYSAEPLLEPDVDPDVETVFPGPEVEDDPVVDLSTTDSDSDQTFAEAGDTQADDGGDNEVEVGPGDSSRGIGVAAAASAGLAGFATLAATAVSNEAASAEAAAQADAQSWTTPTDGIGLDLSLTPPSDAQFASGTDTSLASAEPEPTDLGEEDLTPDEGTQAKDSDAAPQAGEHSAGASATEVDDAVTTAPVVAEPQLDEQEEKGAFINIFAPPRPIQAAAVPAATASSPSKTLPESPEPDPVDAVVSAPELQDQLSDAPFQQDVPTPSIFADAVEPIRNQEPPSPPPSDVAFAPTVPIGPTIEPLPPKDMVEETRALVEPEAKAESRFDSLLQRVHGTGPTESSADDIPPGSRDAQPEFNGEASSYSFPAPGELAARSGDETISGLLCASAAWLTLVQGKSQFTRREVMEVLQSIPTDQPRELADRIKGFGKLVRSGSLILVDDGAFAMAQFDRDRFRSLMP